MTAEEFFQGSDTKEYELSIWSVNNDAYLVFSQCQLSTAGMAGTCTGISSVEVEAALKGYTFDDEESRRIRHDVLYMGTEAARYLNRKKAV